MIYATSIGMSPPLNNVPKHSWQQLQSESDFCDVTLVCDNGNIKAHKFIVSSCSQVLKILKSH